MFTLLSPALTSRAGRKGAASERTEGVGPPDATECFNERFDSLRGRFRCLGIDTARGRPQKSR